MQADQLTLIDGPLSVEDWLTQAGLDAALDLWRAYHAAQDAAAQAVWQWRVTPTWANEDAARNAAEYQQHLKLATDPIVRAYWQYSMSYPRQWQVAAQS